jgi:periplasmic divalent cation tolerance protein
MDEILVLTTTDSRELAGKIAAALVESNAAACVNIVEGIRSVYRWKGEVCDENEWLLLIKSIASRQEAIRAMIRDLHSYEVPEMIVISLSGGDPDYLAWLARQVTLGADP